MSDRRYKIIKAVNDAIAWARGEIRLPMWLPDGTKADLSVDEWVMLGLNEPSEFRDPTPTNPNSRSTG